MPLRPDEEKEWVFAVQTPQGVVVCNVRKIQSGNIEWVGWPQISGQDLLFVEFKGGSRYVYNGVSRQRAVALANAESTGSYFAKHIREKYETLKLR